MKKGEDIAAEFTGLTIVHHNLPASEVDIHSHEEHEIIIPLSGEMTFQFEGITLVCGTGKMIYIPPGKTHSFKSSKVGGERVLALVSHKAWLESAGTTSFSQKILPLSQLAKELLFYLLLRPKCQNHMPFLEAFVSAVADSISTGARPTLLEKRHLLGMVEDGRVKKAISIMDREYGRNITQVEIAKESGAGLRTLSRLFLNEIGYTPKQVLTHIRMAKASDLLVNKRVSVTEAAFEVGYESLSTFIKNFQSLTGCLPSEFQKIGRKS